MNTLKELVIKIYSDLQNSERINEYPDLSNKKVLAESLEAIALDSLEDFVPKDKLNEFADESEQSYTESTFKKYIPNYSEFLSYVENEFYNSLIIWLTEEEYTEK